MVEFEYWRSFGMLVNEMGFRRLQKKIGYNYKVGQTSSIEKSMNSLVDARLVAVQHLVPRDGQELNTASQVVLVDVRSQMRVDYVRANKAKVVHYINKHTHSN